MIMGAGFPDNMLTFLSGLGLTALGLGASLHALLNKRDSKSSLAWVVISLALPLIGPLLYLVFGINRTSIWAQRAFPVDSEQAKDETTGVSTWKTLSPLSSVGESVTKKGLRSCGDVQLLENGEGLYPGMLEEITKATSRIYLATYIFQKDRIGLQIVKALSDAKARGVDVRVIVDGLGAIAYPPGIIRTLRKHDLNFRLFNPIRLLPPSLHINMRNHRKLLIVDGLSAYTGGQNISERHLVENVTNRRRTRDLHFRLAGEIVEDLEQAFLRDWNRCDGGVAPGEDSPPMSKQSESDIWSRMILDGPNENLDKLNELLVGIFSSATKRIWIMTPYFLPGLDLIGALKGALLKGVDVRIFLPQKTNIHMASWAVQHNIRFIVSRGLAVYLQPPPFVHTKAIVIDDNYALIGSANLDPRSLRLNFEIGVEIFSETFNSQLTAYFQQQLATSTLIDEDVERSRPAWQKYRNAIAWLFSPYL